MDRERPGWPWTSLTITTEPPPSTTCLTVTDRPVTGTHLPILDMLGRYQACRICGERLTTERPWLAESGGMYHADCHATARAGKHLRAVKKDGSK